MVVTLATSSMSTHSEATDEKLEVVLSAESRDVLCEGPSSSASSSSRSSLGGSLAFNYTSTPLTIIMSTLTCCFKLDYIIH